MEQATAVLPELAPDEKRCSKCGEVKGRGEFYRSKAHQDGLNSKCRDCMLEILRGSEQRRRIHSGKDILTCPICGREVLVLSTHATKMHGVNRHQLLNDFGISKIVSSDSSKIYSKSGSHPKYSFRRGDVVEIRNGSFITFPKSYWPEDCSYAKIIVEHDKFRVLFNPCNNKLLSAKSISTEGNNNGKNSYRLKIRVHEELLNSLDIIRPIYKLREGAGFFIDFEENDKALLDVFEIWSKSGYAMKNISKLSTYNHILEPKFSLADHIWPENAEYVYPEWSPSARQNSVDFLDLIPVSRTGFIVSSKSNEFKQYIGLKGCVKLRRNHRRLDTRPTKFMKKNNIPSGDWDLKETLPSGALRFRMYQERVEMGA